ncbi:MAG: glycosyltransferase [Tepidisphaeraceae bacterium]
MTRPRRFLILSQVYVPDPAAVGQHLHEVAAALVARGHSVKVVCSSRGYDDPDRVYPTRETVDGVQIRRYGLPIFSKTNMLLRLFGSAWAMAALFFLGLFGGRTDCVVFSTSPPMVGVLAIFLAALKRAKNDLLGDGPQPRSARGDGQAENVVAGLPGCRILQSAHLAAKHADRHARPLHGRPTSGGAAAPARNPDSSALGPGTGRPAGAS